MTMHYTAKRVFKLSNVLGLHLPTEIEISLAFMTSLSGMFAKGMKAVKKKTKLPQNTAAYPQACTKVLISDCFSSMGNGPGYGTCDCRPLFILPRKTTDRRGENTDP